MTQSTIEALMDRWESDAAFRAQMRRDPAGAVKAAGFTLTKDEHAALRAIDWSLSDQELAARANKMGG